MFASRLRDSLDVLCGRLGAMFTKKNQIVMHSKTQSGSPTAPKTSHTADYDRYLRHRQRSPNRSHSYHQRSANRFCHGLRHCHRYAVCQPLARLFSSLLCSFPHHVCISYVWPIFARAALRRVRARLSCARPPCRTGVPGTPQRRSFLPWQHRAARGKRRSRCFCPASKALAPPTPKRVRW